MIIISGAQRAYNIYIYIVLRFNRLDNWLISVPRIISQQPRGYIERLTIHSRRIIVLYRVIIKGSKKNERVAKYNNNNN